MHDGLWVAPLPPKVRNCRRGNSARPTPPQLLHAPPKTYSLFRDVVSFLKNVDLWTKNDAKMKNFVFSHMCFARYTGDFCRRVPYTCLLFSVELMYRIQFLIRSIQIWCVRFEKITSLKICDHKIGKNKENASTSDYMPSEICIYC